MAAVGEGSHHSIHRHSNPKRQEPGHEELRTGSVLSFSRESEEVEQAEEEKTRQKEEAKMMLRSDLTCMRNIVLRMVGPESQHVVWLMNPPWAHSYNFGLDRNWQEALDCVATFGRTMLMHSQMQVEHPPRPLHMSWR